MSTVILGGRVKISDVVNVARYGYKVEFSDKYVERVKKCRKYVEDFNERGELIYGITTGLGDNWNKYISEEDRISIQKNTVLSHGCSVGDPLEEECVRAMMFVMLVHFGTGYTGITLETLELIRELLNKEITPFVPKHGSVGYLSLEAHIGQVLIGKGKVYWGKELLSTQIVFDKNNIKPLILLPKEGLTITSGTTSVTAITSLALYDAINIVKTSDISAALSLEVLKGKLMAMDERIMLVRPHEDQVITAKNIRRILEGSEIIDKYKEHRVQDALSLRCIPQLHGAVKKLLKDSLVTLEVELNSSVDNPLIFKDLNDEPIALMGCNADGSYVGMAADIIAIGITNLAKISERRVDRMVNRHVSELPAFLNKNPGLNNGLMIVQYSAAGILGEMRIASHPATIDNVPTCANQEDYVSMGYNAALKAYECVKLSKYIISIELLCGTQALDFYEGVKNSKATSEVYRCIRSHVPTIIDDINMHPYIEKIAELIISEKIIKVVEDVIGEIEF